MSYENLPVAMNCHTGIFDAGKYSIFGEIERDTPSSRYFTSIFQKITKYSNVLYLWDDLALFPMWCLEMGNVQSHTKWPYTKVSSKY